MVIDNICRVLACGTSILGFATYRCSCLNCSHTNRICHSCNLGCFSLNKALRQPA
ncbi:MAG: hypothetical protein K0U59_05865 [Gammaproteobacteria bacterium]|nr:hypothetical protein [Gammaproteobacteria bacterium]